MEPTFIMSAGSLLLGSSKGACLVLQNWIFHKPSSNGTCIHDEYWFPLAWFFKMSLLGSVWLDLLQAFQQWNLHSWWVWVPSCLVLQKWFPVMVPLFLACIDSSLFCHAMLIRLSFSNLSGRAKTSSYLSIDVYPCRCVDMSTHRRVGASPHWRVDVDF